MSTPLNWYEAAEALTEVLGLTTPPIAITFSQTAPEGVDPFDAPMPAPTPDGRTGRVSAGCVFWTEALDRTFSTVAADHGNCSVGSLIHGFVTLNDVASNSDVAALVESGWVTMDMVPTIPVITERPGAVTYGPLADSPVDPDVVMIRVNGEQLMELTDAFPGLRIDGKPQCHIVAVAKQEHEVAVSVGCRLSRTRTAMSENDMTCTIPGDRLFEVISQLQSTTAASAIVAAYAAEDARRFVARQP
jgi:uncharacterized protein (DUF169 family)